MYSITSAPVRRLSAVAIIAALAACGGQEQDNRSTGSATTQEAPAAAPAKPAAPAYPAGVFERPAASRLRTAGNCTLDRINKQEVGAETYAVGDELLLGGWFAPPKGVPARAALVVFDDGNRQFAHAFTTGGKREDVAKRLERPELATSGYNVRVRLDGVPAGDYQVWLAQEGDGGFRCPTRKTITVAG